MRAGGGGTAERIATERPRARLRDRAARSRRRRPTRPRRRCARALRPCVCRVMARSRADGTTRDDAGRGAAECPRRASDRLALASFDESNRVATRRECGAERRGLVRPAQCTARAAPRRAAPRRAAPAPALNSAEQKPRKSSPLPPACASRGARPFGIIGLAARRLRASKMGTNKWTRKTEGNYVAGDCDCHWRVSIIY